MIKYEYQHSGIDWIGRVPKHWKISRIIQRVENVVGGEWGSDAESEDNKESKDIVVLRVADFNDIYINYENPTIRKVLKSKIPNRILNDRCLIMEKSGGGEKQLVGRVVEPKELPFEAITSNFIAKIEFDIKVDRHYMNYIFYDLYNSYLNFPFVQQTTGIQNINSTYYLNTKVAFPPKPEQIAIADYLDKVCANIDRVVEIKRKQIEKTSDLFFAFLDEIFTKNSAGWMEERLKDICEINPTPSDNLTENTLVTIIPMESVSEYGEIDNSQIIQYKEVINGLNYFENGDVIFAKITPCMENGKGALVKNLKTEVAFGSTEFIVVRPSKKILADLIYFYTRSKRFRKEAEANMKGAAGQQRVTPKYFYNAKILFPHSIKQQKEIIEQIESFISKNFKTSEILNKQTETLLTYKKSLIHEIVTGKKQVYDINK